MKFEILDITYELGEINLDTKELISTFEISIEKKKDLFEKVGTKKLYQTKPETDFVTLSTKCIKNLLKNNTIDEDKLGILFVTQSNSRVIPGEGQRIRHACNLSESVFVLDLNIGCSGFIYALFLAVSMLQTNGFKNIIVVAGDTYRKYLDPNDRSTSLLFSDAVSAVLLDCNRKSEIIGFDFGGDGLNYEDISMAKVQLEGQPIYFKMNGAKVFSYTKSVIPKSVNKVLSIADRNLEDIKLFFFHQASEIVLQTLKSNLQISESKLPITLQELGNTGSASIPITLYKYLKNGSLKSDDNIILSGFGIGLSYGTVLLRW
jgi:3-oxoacyl-[acyl-carrier-protein] synthase-3